MYWSRCGSLVQFVVNFGSRTFDMAIQNESIYVAQHVVAHTWEHKNLTTIPFAWNESLIPIRLRAAGASMVVICNTWDWSVVGPADSYCDHECRKTASAPPQTLLLHRHMPRHVLCVLNYAATKMPIVRWNKKLVRAFYVSKHLLQTCNMLPWAWRIRYNDNCSRGLAGDENYTEDNPTSGHRSRTDPCSSGARVPPPVFITFYCRRNTPSLLPEAMPPGRPRTLVTDAWTLPLP